MHAVTRAPVPYNLPSTVYLGVMIHSKTSRRDLVDELCRLGLSIAYDRLLSISSELGNNICRYLQLEGTVCPSSICAQDSFHCARISLFQHPNSDVSGVQRIVDTYNPAITATTVASMLSLGVIPWQALEAGAKTTTALQPEGSSNRCSSANSRSSQTAYQENCLPTWLLLSKLL